MKMTYSQYDALKQKGYDDAKIAALAERNGVELPSDSILGGIVNTALITPGVRVGQVLGAGAAKLMGRSSEEIGAALDKDVNVNLGPLGEVKVRSQKTFDNGGAKQIVGQAANAASLYAPYGRIAGAIAGPATKLVGNRVGQAIGLAGAGATGGYLAEKGSSLERGQETSFTPGVTTALSAAIPASIPIISPFLRKSLQFLGKGAKGFVAGLSSLDNATIETALLRPDELSAAQRNAMSRMTFVESVQTNFKKAMQDVTSTGNAYNALKQTGQRVKNTAQTFQNYLKKNDILIDGNGKIVLGKEAPPLSPEDVGQLERFFVRFGNVDDMSVNQFLNGRQMLDEFSNWSATKTDVGDRLMKGIRKEWDKVGKTTVKGLEKLDAEYAPMKQMLEDVRRRAFDKNGNLLEGGASYIANLSKETNFIRANKFEKLMPGITQQAQILAAIEDIARSSGVKVGGYMRTGAVGAGFLFGGGPVGAILTFLATHPNTIIPIVKTFGRMNNIASKVISSISSKLSSGAQLTPGEQATVRLSIIEHLKNISPGDQFIDSITK